MYILGIGDAISDAFRTLLLTLCNIVYSLIVFFFTIFEEMGTARLDINVDIILQSVGRDGTKDISFTVSEDEADEAVAIIQKSFPKSEYKKIDEEKDVAKISIVGAGMMTNPGVAATMFEALYDCGVNIKMISTSEIRVTVLIDEKYTEKAMNAVHDKFSLAD